MKLDFEPIKGTTQQDETKKTLKLQNVLLTVFKRET